MASQPFQVFDHKYCFDVLEDNGHIGKCNSPKPEFSERYFFSGTPCIASKIITHQEWMQTQALQAGWGLCISWAETTRSVIPFKQKSINWLRNRALNQIQTIKNPRTSGHQERVRVLSYTSTTISSKTSTNISTTLKISHTTGYWERVRVRRVQLPRWSWSSSCSAQTHKVFFSMFNV